MWGTEERNIGQSGPIKWHTCPAPLNSQAERSRETSGSGWPLTNPKAGSQFLPAPPLPPPRRPEDDLTPGSLSPALLLCLPGGGQREAGKGKPWHPWPGHPSLQDRWQGWWAAMKCTAQRPCQFLNRESWIWPPVFKGPYATMCPAWTEARVYQMAGRLIAGVLGSFIHSCSTITEPVLCQVLETQRGPRPATSPGPGRGLTLDGQTQR